jgi:hypothetical protein
MSCAGSGQDGELQKGLARSFTDNGDGTATLSGTPAAGTIGTYPLTIMATNAAGSTVQSFTLTVRSSTQTISFPAIADRLFGAAPFTVAPTASSGLPVSLVSTTTSVCTVSGPTSGGFTVSVLAAGVCALTASQAGNGSWQQAADVGRTFTVGYVVTNLAPPNKSSFKAGSTIPVKFQLSGAGGQVISDSLAASLGCTVKVAFDTQPPVCAAYDRRTHLFQANLPTPSNLRRGTAYPIVITVKVGTTTVATTTVSVSAK